MTVYKGDTKVIPATYNSSIGAFQPQVMEYNSNIIFPNQAAERYPGKQKYIQQAWTHIANDSTKEGIYTGSSTTTTYGVKGTYSNGTTKIALGPRYQSASKVTTTKFTGLSGITVEGLTIPALSSWTSTEMYIPFISIKRTGTITPAIQLTCAISFWCNSTMAAHIIKYDSGGCPSFRIYYKYSASSYYNTKLNFLGESSYQMDNLEKYFKVNNNGFYVVYFRTFWPAMSNTYLAISLPVILTDLLGGNIGTFDTYKSGIEFHRTTIGLDVINNV